MADPVSLLGTLPALVTLPAVTLQAVQTIHNFYKSLKNATIDVQQLLKEVEMMQTLLRNIRAQCDQATSQGVEHNDLQDLLQVIGLLNERMEAPLKELRELRESMKKPSRTGFNITSRIRKYLSEGEFKDHLDHLLRLVVTLQLIYLQTDARRMQQLHAKTDAMQQDIHLIIQRLPNPSTSTAVVPQSPAAKSQQEVSSETRPNVMLPKRTRQRSRCIQGLCGCLCHRISNYQRSWLISSHTACFVACGCADRNYRWTVSLFGRLITFKAGFRDNGVTSIGWNISPSNSVPRTSPGFVVIEKCKLGTLKASEASRDLRVLLSSGVISVKDQNPDGESYIDFLLRGPWMYDAGNQLELLKTLAHDGFFWENDKLLRCLLSWVGEVPHLDLFNTMLSLFDFTQGFRPETMTEWPRPFDPGFVEIFRYADVLFLKVIAGLAAEDPDFGGTTPLQAAILSNKVDAVEKLLSPVPPSDIFARNFLGQSALHLAIRNPRMVSLLLDAGYSSHVDVTDQHGITPLIYAAGYGFIETMKVLLMAGADPYRRDELTHMCMWHYVLFCHKSEFVKELLGFYMATKHETANSAVELCLWIRIICHNAESTDYSCETLEYLLQVRSTERKPYYKKYSLLHLCWNISQAQLLLKYRCDGVNHRNIQGYTPMMVLTRLPTPAGALQMLIEQSANLSIRDDHGMNALHHLNASVASFSSWGASRKDKWTDWLDAIAILISAGGDINKNDKCSCPCSSAGCSPIRGLFWEDYDLSASQENALEAIPWMLELSLVLKHSGKQDSLAQAASEFHRFQTFEEWGMTHTCWIHGEHDYHGPRPQVKFYSPHEDFRKLEGNDTANVEERLKGSKDWDLEFAEITDEEKELAHRLDVECSNYFRMLDDTFEDRWIELLARRAVLLEHQMKSCLAKEQGGWMLKESMIGPELPPQELLISGSPLEYIDKQNDEFVPHFDFSEIFESLVKRKERNFEHCQALFLNSFNTDSHTYTYMGGETRQAWDAERKDLLSSLYQKVRHLRSIPLERRGWDVDLI